MTADAAQDAAQNAAQDAAKLERVRRVIGGVLKEALRSTGTRAIVLLDPESPEGVLVTGIAAAAGVPLVEYSEPGECLTAHPATKTTLLTGSFFPRADLLPLGDLYASQVYTLTGEWPEDDGVRAVAAAVGGIDRLDAMLEHHIDRRALLTDSVFDEPAGARDVIRAALERTRFRRRTAGLVPKLGTRTIGVDLLD